MDTLLKIINYKKSSIASAKNNLPISHMNMERKTKKFTSTILRNHYNHKINIIAEIKKASPSQGIIMENCDVAKIAQEYENGGAKCISVLTDDKFFGGSHGNIKIAQQKTTLPILRKDFIVDVYQIYESKHIGADAILLIASILTEKELTRFEEVAFHLGMDVLVEVNNQAELDIVLECTKTPLIGINNRNLRDLSINKQNIFHLLNLLPEGRVPICESGIKSRKDIDDVKKSGCCTFLVGTSLMQSEQKKDFLQSLCDE